MKTAWLRDEEYLEFVRQVPCALHEPGGALDPWRYQDGVRRSVPHHLPVIGLKGVGIKSPDQAVVPVCDQDHEYAAAFYRRPQDIWARSGEQPMVWVNGFELYLPTRFYAWNPYETAWRLLWAYVARALGTRLEEMAL